MGSLQTCVTEHGTGNLAVKPDISGEARGRYGPYILLFSSGQGKEDSIYEMLEEWV